MHVPNLAPHVLKLATARIVQDWRQRYGYAPVLVETFVDPARYKGTCYRAANWRYVGQTAARATAYANGKVSDGAKDIYLLPPVPERATAVAPQKQARQRLDWYSRRWGIEIYHCTIISGYRIQDRRLDHTNNLMACLAIDLVVAWRFNG